MTIRNRLLDVLFPFGEFLQFPSDDLPSGICLFVKAIEIVNDTIDVALKLLPHFLLPLELCLTLTELISQFFLVLALMTGRMHLTVLLLLLLPDQEVVVLFLQSNYGFFQDFYLIAQIDLFIVKFLDLDTTVNRRSQGSQLPSQVLVVRISHER